MAGSCKQHSGSMNGGEYTEQLSEAESVTSTNCTISISLRTSSKDVIQRPERCYCTFNETVIKQINLLQVIYLYIL